MRHGAALKRSYVKVKVTGKGTISSQMDYEKAMREIMTIKRSPLKTSRSNIGSDLDENKVSQ